MIPRLLLLLAVCLPLSSGGADLSRETLAWVGNKVWQNECGGTVAGLVSWNSGEEFASLGIGHFIWYPKGKRGPFEESFPALARSLQSSGTRLPEWALGPCPWNDRKQFLAESKGEKADTLRRILAATTAEQAEFLAARMRDSLPKMLVAVPAAEREAVKRNFEALRASKAGLFALIDYVNFKGEGTLETERYRGQGWGLLQVLAEMRGGSNTGAPVEEFSRSARRVLERRVSNSPPERGEARWLKGWSARVEAYAR